MGVAVLISDRADIKARKVIKEKDGHHIMIKQSILQEDTRILNVYSSNNMVSNYMRQKTDRTSRRNR